MTTVPHPFISHSQDPLGIAQNLQAALNESLRVTAVGLFWLAALPIAAIFSFAASLYSSLGTLKSTTFRLPYLRSHLAITPLVLRRRSFANHKTNVRTTGRKETARG